MASLAALAWSSGTWWVEKSEGWPALNVEGRALVSGTAKDTVGRVTLSPSATNLSGADTT